MAFSRVLALRLGCPVTLAHWRGEPGVPFVLFKSTILQSFTLMARNGFSRVLALRLGVLWHWHTGGGSLVSPLSCLSQRYSNLLLSWSEMAFSRVLALRVGVLWHWHTGGRAWCPLCLVRVNDTPIFHSYGPKWLLVEYWHWGWVSCDTGTLEGGAWCSLCLV